MRVLLCQTPRLTYVQAIELLQRETLGGQVDLALFPELAIEHPPQCTGQGELTFENVALLMLSRFCKQKRMYLVLGSVEERAHGCLYDTCIVLNRDGEFLYKYRKRSGVFLGKTAGDEPGIFDSEFGPIGILLSSEIEEDSRWQDILVRKPYLVLNPARAPMQLDPVLLHTHPELQNSAWHKSLRRLEHIVEARTRQCACSFVRADAPFQDGGAGTSILFEPHRSVLPPRWGACFFVVDTMHPYELEGRKLPGWRQLSIDERATSAAHDRALLLAEEIERGPRYMVWTLRPGDKGGLKVGLSHWNNSAAQRDRITHLENSALSDGVVNIGRAGAFLVPIIGKDGRQLYATVTVKGAFLIWDVKMKRELSSSQVGATGLSAMSAWKGTNQIILASSAKGMTTLKVFEEHEAIAELRLDDACKVAKHRKSSVAASPRKAHLDREKTQSALPVLANAKRTPFVRALFHVRSSIAVVIFEAIDEDHGPTAMLADLDDGTAQSLDVYGSGPPPISLEDDESDSSKADMVGHQTVDRLVRADVVDLQVRTKMQRVLACLYDSNRLVQIALGDKQLHEFLLLEDGAGERQRSDCPVNFAVLRTQSHSETYHVVVSYQSMYLRWFQVSLTMGKLQAQVVLTATVTHLTLLEWPSPPRPGLPIEKPSGASTGPKRATVRASIHHKAIVNDVGNANHRQSVRVFTQAEKDRESDRTPLHARPSVLGPLASPRSRQSIQRQNSFVSQTSRTQRESRILGRMSVSYKAHDRKNATPSSTMSPHDDRFMAKDHISLCIVAFDVMGGLPILLARGAKIAKVYTCSDHFGDKSAKVDQLLCDGKTIAVQLSNGDIRHIEFAFEDDQLSLKDIPMDFPT
mmetsp:Transcript_46850/g.73079  ORF Transcript_46850/g.73079 Transcript_46850/m.73079 type:complete len:863 (+) Transcript_46850:105-2693(+)